MSDTNIVDWLEQNSNTFLLVPPDDANDEWSLYRNHYQFVASGDTFRECISNYVTKK